MMKQKTKLFTVLCGVALAVIVAINPAEALRTKGNVQKNNILKSIDTRSKTIIVVDTIKGYCSPSDYKCGITANGTTLFGTWVE